MNIIVPMAGRGSRLRPHTLTTPKPMLPVAGVPIVSRLVRDIVKLLNQPVTNIGFVLGDPVFLEMRSSMNSNNSQKNSVQKHIFFVSLKPWEQDTPFCVLSPCFQALQ